jgi:hypothetical protein
VRFHDSPGRSRLGQAPVGSFAEEIDKCTINIAAALLKHFDDGVSVVLPTQSLLDSGYLPWRSHLYNSRASS